jgi:hypothetical protein
MLGISWTCEYRITDTSLGNRLEPCHNISDLSLIECLAGCILGTEASDLQTLDLGSCIDEFEFISFFDLSGE